MLAHITIKFHAHAQDNFKPPSTPKWQSMSLDSGYGGKKGLAQLLSGRLGSPHESLDAADDQV
jgi:hypothetical protein